MPATGWSVSVRAVMLNVFDAGAETLPAASLARYSTVCEPASVTWKGAEYAVHSPPSRRYSSVTVPGVSSWPDSVTVTGAS